MWNTWTPRSSSALLFRSSRPDSIETTSRRTPSRSKTRQLFRSSRPDSIETYSDQFVGAEDGVLFRSSRPDSIETRNRARWVLELTAYCSGLLGRTPLRHCFRLYEAVALGADCSGLLGRTPLRHNTAPAQRRLGSNCSGLLGRTPLRPSRL